MCRKLCNLIWGIWWFHRSKDFEYMKAGKLAIWPWLSQYTENTLKDLPSSVHKSNFMIENWRPLKIKYQILIASAPYHKNQIHKYHFLVTLIPSSFPPPWKWTFNFIERKCNNLIMFHSLFVNSNTGQNIVLVHRQKCKNFKFSWGLWPG